MGAVVKPGQVRCQATYRGDRNQCTDRAVYRVSVPKFPTDQWNRYVRSSCTQHLGRTVAFVGEGQSVVIVVKLADLGL